MKSIYSIFGDILLFAIFVCILVIPSLTLINLTPIIVNNKAEGEIAGEVQNQKNKSIQTYDKVEFSDEIKYSENIILNSKKSLDKSVKSYSFKLIQLDAFAKEKIDLGTFKSSGTKSSLISIKITPKEVSDYLTFEIITNKYIKEISGTENEVSLEIDPSEISNLIIQLTATEEIRNLDFKIDLF
jgi:hypothetical protein